MKKTKTSQYNQQKQVNNAYLYKDSKHYKNQSRLTKLINIMSIKKAFNYFK